jgi:hypothetical protein
VLGQAVDGPQELCLPGVIFDRLANFADYGAAEANLRQERQVISDIRSQQQKQGVDRKVVPGNFKSTG